MSAAGSLREWVVEVRATCSGCAATDSASLISRSCEDARRNAVKVLRYRGWRLMAEGHRYDDLCPKCAPPLPACEVCGDPTPREYSPCHARHITGVDFACWGCYHAKFDQLRRGKAGAR